MLKPHVCISGYHNGYIHTDEADWIMSVKSDNWIQVSIVSNNACKHTGRKIKHILKCSIEYLKRMEAQCMYEYW